MIEAPRESQTFGDQNHVEAIETNKQKVLTAKQVKAERERQRKEKLKQQKAPVINLMDLPGTPINLSENLSPFKNVPPTTIYSAPMKLLGKRQPEAKSRG